MDKTWTKQSSSKNGFRKRRDMSGHDFYRSNWVNKGKRKNLEKRETKTGDKINLRDEYDNITSANFSWINNCVL